jgi:hypothetical protein
MSSESEQLQFLSTFLQRKKGKNVTKSEVVARIRKNYLFTDSARMTNTHKHVFRYASLFVRYEYLRQHTTFVPDKTSHALLLSCKAGPSTLIHFTHSGHGAILQALGFLKSLGFQTYQKSSTLYWETEQTLEMFNFKSTPEPEVYWIDSSSFDVFSDWSIPESVKWVVVDSTCWQILGKEFEFLSEKLKDHEVITVRSHVKLDMLGVEYAPLGSITLSSRALETTAGTFYQSARLLASTASPESIPPYLLEMKNLKLCLKRGKGFQKNHQIFTEIASEYLKEFQDVIFQFPPHGLYFYLAYKHCRYSVSEIQKHVLGLDDGFGLKSIESFGFDQFALQVYRPRRDPNFEMCIRISYGVQVQSKTHVRKFLKGILSFMNQP